MNALTTLTTLTPDATATATATATSLGDLFAQLSPAVQAHLAFALAALVLGPLALWLRKGSTGHRGAGRVWVVLMLGTAVTSLFIRDFRLPNLGGYTPIHLLTLASFVGLGLGVWAAVQRRLQRHRRAMQSVYASLVIAGAFTLLPHRFLGQVLWHHALGWV